MMGTRIGSHGDGPFYRRVWGQSLAMKARAIALLAVALAAFSAGGALTYHPEYFDKLRVLTELDLETVLDNGMTLTRIVFILMAVAHALFGCYLVWLSTRALFAGQFPPPGTRVARNQTVLYGTVARIRAAAGVVFGVALIIAGVMIPFFAYQTTKIFFDVAGGFPIDPEKLLKFR